MPSGSSSSLPESRTRRLELRSAGGCFYRVMRDPTQAVLLYFILRFGSWRAFADWFCHRATDIEHTAGAKESLIHLLMFGGKFALQRKITASGPDFTMSKSLR